MGSDVTLASTLIISQRWYNPTIEGNNLSLISAINGRPDAGFGHANISDEKTSHDDMVQYDGYIGFYPSRAT